MGLVNAALVPRRLLAAGLTQSEATQAFGQISGMVAPLLYMPMVLIGPITQVMVPAVAELTAKGRRDGVQRLLRKAFLAAGAVSAATAGALWLFPVEIGRILYNAPHVAPLIRPTAVAAPLVFFATVSRGILYGLGRTGAVMVNVLAGNVTRCLLIYLLVPNPAWGIRGAAWALVADCAVTAVLNLVCLACFMGRAGSKEYRSPLRK